METAFSVIQNISLLSLGAIALVLVMQYWRLPSFGNAQAATFGLILGGISVLVVGAPIQGPYGATFDNRGAPLVMAGYFAGPLGGAIAAGLGAIARYHVGGPFALTGIVSIALYPVAGVAFGWFSRRGGRGKLGVKCSLLLAVVSTAFTAPSFLLAPSMEVGIAAFLEFWPVLLAGNLISIPLLGLTIQFLLNLSEERDRYQLETTTSSFARQTARIGVWSHDLSTDRISWDSVQQDLIGTPSGSSDQSYQSFVDRILPEDRNHVAEALNAAKASGTPFESRFRIRTPDGQVRHIVGHGDFVRDAETGAPRHMIGVNIDVTREEDLLGQIRLNSTALDSAVCGVLIAEARDDHPVVYVNKAFTEITGYAPEEILGTNCRLLNRGLPDQPELQTVRRSLRLGEPCTVTLRNRRKNGETFWLTLNLSPIRDGEDRITHFVGIQEDVTEQVTARQVIAQDRDEVEAILSAAPDAILTVDADQKIASFNQAAVRLFGWEKDEIIGKSIQNLVPDFARRSHGELARNYIEDPDSSPGPMSFLRIVQAQRKDGTTFPAQVMLARYLVGGKPMVTATAHDMSDTVKTKDELVRLSHQLRLLLEEAHRNSEAKDQFLAHMSHELRTPLNAIIGFSELLTTLGIERLGPERTQEYVSDIKLSGEHLLELIDDILDLSKIQAGKAEIDIMPVPSETLVKEALTTTGPAFSRRNIEVVTEMNNADVVLCDRRLTLQCLLNLLSNAAKFSPSGSRVAVRTVRIDDGVRFAIEDQGDGVPDAVLKRIGEPFLRRDDPLTSDGPGGSGLGLAITKSLIEQQNGSLTIEGGAKGGTVASIWLPAHDKQPAVDDEAVGAC